MRKRPGVAAVMLAAATSGLFAPAGAGAATKATDCRGANDPVTAANVATAERTLLCEVNVLRVAEGLQPLTEDPALIRTARGHSEQMERVGELKHEGIGDGTTSDRARQAGFQCGDIDCVGENIAYSGFAVTNPTDLFMQWRNSTDHNANMLDDNYVTAGMGLAVGPNFGTTGTQNFATVSNGATSTAADMLTNADCDGADSDLERTKAAVEKAKKKVVKAKKPDRRRKARKKLRRAKAEAKAAQGSVDDSCNLSY